MRRARHELSPTRRDGARSAARDRTPTAFVYAVTLDRRLLPALVPEPAAAARSRVVLRDAGEARAAGFRACKRCQPDAIAPAADPWIDKSPPRVRLPGERRRAPVARDAGAAARRQPVSPAAELQAAGRRHAARVRGRVPAGQGEAAPARRPATSPARCSTPATDRAAASTSAPCRSSGWRRRSTGAAARACASVSRSSTPRTRRSAACSSRRPIAASARWRWARRTRELTARCRAEYPAATIVADAGALASGRAPSSRTSPARSRGSICRSTCRPPHSSGGSGRRSPRSRTARRAPTARSPQRSGARARCAQSRARVRPTLSRSRSRAIASCPPRAASGGYRWGAERKKALLAGGQEGRNVAGRQNGQNVGGRRRAGT